MAGITETSSAIEESTQSSQSTDLRSEIIRILNEAQVGLYQHKKLLNSLRSIFDNESTREFFDTFLPPLQNILVILRREPALERLIDFIAKFTVSVAPKNPDGNSSSSSSDEDSYNDDSFINLLLSTITTYLEAREKAVRFRVCQLIWKIFATSYKDSSQHIKLSTHMIEHLSDALHERLKDKVALVRIHSAQAISYLQDPSDASCPITSALLWLMEHDSSYEVRKTVITNISITQQSLLAIITRTRDVKDVVRRTAFLTLAEKLSICNFTIAQRLQMLNDGMKDDSDIVRESCINGLMRKWCMELDEDILKFLRRLDVESSSDIVELVLMNLFKEINNSELVHSILYSMGIEEEERNDIDKENNDGVNTDNECLLAGEDLDEDNEKNHMKVIPLELLDCETVFYWRCLCKYFKTLKTPEGMTHLDNITPSLSVFCDYFMNFLEKRVMCSVSDDAGERTLDAELAAEYQAIQLCDIISYLDFTDEAGRVKLNQLVCELLVNPKFLVSLITPILSRQTSIWPHEFYRIEKMIELISQIQYSDDTITSDSMEDESSHLKNDTATLIRCLVISGELFKDLSCRKLTPHLLTLIDSLLLPCVQSQNPHIRDLSIYSLGLACLLDISLARHHILLFIQASQVDHENVRATALKVIFDLISLYGFDLFNVEVEPEAQATETETQTTSESQDESQSHALHMLSELLAGGEATNEDTTILNLLSNFLNNESVLLLEIACEGMCKLLLSGKISSVSLLVKLFLIWYDPSYQSQDRLKAVLGYFFPSYSACNKSCRCNIAECYIHFMQTIAEASPHSTLIDVDVNNAADFIINLSAPVLPNEDSSHDGLALQILNYLLSNDDDDIGWLRLHCKSLNILVLTSSNKINAKNVRVLLHRLMELVIDKQSLRDLKKFNITLEKIIPTSVTAVEPTGGDEKENTITGVTSPNGQSPSITTTLSPNSPSHVPVIPMTTRRTTRSLLKSNEQESLRKKGLKKKKSLKKNKKSEEDANDTLKCDDGSDDSLVGEHSPFICTPKWYI